MDCFSIGNDATIDRMDSVQMMRVFVRVAQRSSFVAAARELRMSAASITKHVAALESRAGVRLLDRTTRSVTMTEAGRIYLERCLECLQAFDDADAALGDLTAEPKGLLRVAAPFDFSRHLPPLVAELVKRHPAVDVDLRLSNRTLAMVDEGVDVYIRITNTLPADAIAVPLATTTFALWGARSYFREHGRPRAPAELREHRFALFDEPPLLDTAVLERGRRKVTVKLRPKMVSNSGEMLMEAVSSGSCLGILPSFLLRPEHAGRVETALAAWSLGRRRIYAVYPHRRFVPAKVRAFVQLMRNTFPEPARDPWWPARAPTPGS